MKPDLPRLGATLVALAIASLLAAVGTAPAREPGPRDQGLPRASPAPPAPKLRSLPYVSVVGQDGRLRHYETNAIPLLWNRACFGWRSFIGGPNRLVDMVEVLTLSAPAKTMIHGPDTVVEGNQRAVTKTRELVMDGFIQRAWCILEGDPPGTYRYDITIDGEPRGEFVFCAIEVASQDEDVDPTRLNCPNKFHGVEYRRPAGLAQTER